MPARLQAIGLFISILSAQSDTINMEPRAVHDPFQSSIHYPGALPSTSNIVKRDSFTVSYNRQLRQPNWVAERLDAWLFSTTRTGDLTIDTSIDPRFSVETSDYLSNRLYEPWPYAAAEFHCGDALTCKDVFMAPTNISPFSQIVARTEISRLNAFLRYLASHRKTENVFVLSGPLWLPVTIDIYPHGTNIQTGNPVIELDVVGEKNSIPVPVGVFKIVKWVRKDGRSFTSAFVFENRPSLTEKLLSSFQVNLENLNKLTGLNLAAMWSDKAICSDSRSEVDCDRYDGDEAAKASRYAVRVEAAQDKRAVQEFARTWLESKNVNLNFASIVVAAILNKAASFMDRKEITTKTGVVQFLFEENSSVKEWFLSFLKNQD